MTAPQLDLLTPPRGSALDALPEHVRYALWQAVESLRPSPLTSDMVWDRLTFAQREIVERHPNAIGACFQWHAKQGVLERAGSTVPSHRRNAKGRRIAVWIWKVR